MNPLVIHGLEWLITAILAGLVGWLTSSFSNRRKHDHALEIGMQVLLRKALIDSFDYYFNQDKKMTIERKREITEMYEAYTLLGGDGVISEMMADLAADKDVWIERG